MALRPNGEKIYLKASPEDHELYREAERRLATESLPLPTLAVRPGHNTNQARGYNYRKRPVFLSITHKLHSDHDAQLNVGEPRHASPDHGVTRWRIVCASEIAT